MGVIPRKGNRVCIRSRELSQPSSAGRWNCSIPDKRLLHDFHDFFSKWEYSLKLSCLILASIYMGWWEKVNILNCYNSTLKWVYSDKLDIARNCGPWDLFCITQEFWVHGEHVWSSICFSLIFSWIMDIFNISLPIGYIILL